ncbi:UNVERIFIED_CONTAM: hypothetical protein NCL1_46381 [Trichonephila clavipes]
MSWNPNTFGNRVNACDFSLPENSRLQKISFNWLLTKVDNHEIDDSEIEPVHDSTYGRVLRKAKSVKIGEKEESPLNTFRFNFDVPEEGNGVFE